MSAKPPIDQQVTFLYAADPEPCWRFYGEVLGLPLALDQGACRIFRVGRDAFLGVCRDSATQRGETGAKRSVIVTLVSDEVDAWHAHLIGLGVAIEKPPTLNAAYAIRHLFLRDPAGYLVEIQTFLDPNWPRAVVASAPARE